MFYVGFAFLFGLFIPYMARRFAKFMPATFACAVVELCNPGKKNRNFRYTKQYKSFLWHSVMSAFIASGITWVALVHFGTFGFGFYVFYVLVLLLLAEIDARTMLLPDILTVPLLLIGFFAASKDMAMVSVTECAVGAVVGYFLPVLVSFLIVWYRRDAFGGGDIKLLSVTGIFLGTSIVSVIWNSFLVAAVISFFQLMIQKNLFHRISYFFSYCIDVIKNKKASAYYNPIQDQYKSAMHFSVAIFGAVLLQCI